MCAEYPGTGQADLVAGQATLIQEDSLYGYTNPLAHPGRRFFFGLLSLCRFAFNPGFWDLPLAVGLFFGYISGDWATSLGVAIFFELFWLDAFPAGTYVPPHRILATFLSLTLALALEFQDPGQIILLLLPSVLLAKLGSKLEIWQRMQQNASYNQLLQWARQESDRFQPEILVKKGLLQLAVANALLYVLSFLACYYLLQMALGFWTLELQGLAWEQIWSLGLLGPILSLRNKRAYQLLVAGAALLVFLI
ncbi:MAG: PTS sugar transporter subunit IIC [Desulfohalobiaceae bacterium]